MATATAATTVMAATAVLLAAAAAMILLAPPASTAVIMWHPHLCDAIQDVEVIQNAWHRQSNDAKKFAVEVVNRAGDAISGIHLGCGYNFHTVRPVDPNMIVLLAPGDCLLIDGGSIVPGGSVSFNYTSYMRYELTLLAATCEAPAPDGP